MLDYLEDDSPPKISEFELYRVNALESRLNGAIVDADIRVGYEEYISLFRRFYSEQVEFSNHTGKI